VVFVLDATGSMADEIEVVKSELVKMAYELRQGQPPPVVRFGLVVYRDLQDEYIAKSFPVTGHVEELRQQIMAVQASGGGDWAEHVAYGLHSALKLNWDMGKDVRRVIYLVGDAPPHMDYQDGFDLRSALEKALLQQITVHVIGCSGLNEGTAQFQNIAQKTGGKFTHLTYQKTQTDPVTREKKVYLYEAGKTYEVVAAPSASSTSSSTSRDTEALNEIDWEKGTEKLVSDGYIKEVVLESTDPIYSASSYSASSYSARTYSMSGPMEGSITEEDDTDSDRSGGSPMMVPAADLPVVSNNLGSLMSKSMKNELTKKGTKYS